MSGHVREEGASVASRLLSVLATFDSDHSALTLTDISQASGLPLSTAKRLIEELTRWGALERASDSRYRIGMRLWEIGSYAQRRRTLRDAALPFMQDLYEAARENVQLNVLDSMEVLVVEKIYGSRAVPTETDVGGRMPLHATGAGKALLAYSPGSILQAAVEQGLNRCTPHTLIEPGRLVTSLREIRRTGVAYSREERVLGVVSVASPIIGPNHTLLGAVAIVARVGTRIDRLAAAVRAASLGISREACQSALRD